MMTLRVILVREPPLRKRPEDGKLVPDERGSQGWVAVCLERFIVADGETIPEAKLALRAAILAEMTFALEENRPPLADLHPAPARYHELWREAERLAEPIHMLSSQNEVVDAEVRVRG